MEVHFTAEMEQKLKDLAAQSGRPAPELVKDAVAGLFDALADSRQLLDRRFDEIESGEVKLIPGDNVFAQLRRKSEARRRKPGP